MAQDVADKSVEGMKRGVAESRTFVLFLTKEVLLRPFVQVEVQTALELKKPIILARGRRASLVCSALLPPLPARRVALRSLPHGLRHSTQPRLCRSTIPTAQVRAMDSRYGALSADEDMFASPTEALQKVRSPSIARSRTELLSARSRHQRQLVPSHHRQCHSFARQSAVWRRWGATCGRR